MLTFRPVRRKGPHLKTCTTCFERKPAYVVPYDTCTACIAQRSVQETFTYR